MSEKTSILDLLLKPETPNVGKSLPTARYLYVGLAVLVFILSIICGGIG